MDFGGWGSGLGCCVGGKEGTLFVRAAESELFSLFGWEREVGGRRGEKMPLNGVQQIHEWL